MHHRRNGLWPLIFGLFVLAATAVAQDAGSVALRVVADRLVVRCDLASSRRRIPVNLLVEYETAAGLQIHSRALQGLRANPGDLLSAHFPGFTIKDMPTELGDEAFYERLTKFHAPELGETALVGTIGFEVLRRFNLIFDRNEGFLHFAPPRAQGDPGERDRETTEVTIDETGGLLWIPVSLPENRLGMMNFGSGAWDTMLDREYCRRAGHPAGDLGSLKIESIDLAPYMAFRPASFNDFHRDGGVGRTGINLLHHFRVEIDRTHGLMRLREARPPRFPQADLEFFRALVTDEAEPVEAWLTRYESERLSAEAADLLLERRLASLEIDVEATGRAIQWAVDTRPADLRATRALELMDRLEQSAQVDLAIAAGKIGLESGRDDRDSNAVHKIHGRIGEHLLVRGAGKEAWRHLLSAAFGMKDDGRINLNLGLYYEREGKLTRAFARFVYAVIKEDTAPRALEGLKRVQAAMGGEDGLLIDVVERLVEGKVPGYGVGETFKPTAKNSTNRRVLAALYTGAHCEPCIAADLAFDGLLSHFPRDKVAVIEYHVPVPLAEPLISPVAAEFFRAARLGGTPAAIFNGTNIKTGGGKEEDKEALYLDYKARVLEELLKPSRHELEIEATVKDDVVSGTLRVRGPRVASARVHLHLVEKGLLFPGKNQIVIHRMVARAALIGNGDGEPHRPDAEDVQEISFSRRLSGITHELDAHLEEVEFATGSMFSMYPTRIDPRQVSLVAFVQDEASGEILQAIQLDPRYPDDELDASLLDEGGR
ncbi:MAG: hypothetical protein KDB53_05715 [Planctomycetes bacterium]|nr:hypothetical protein [Planctomycetota bacterium]